MAYDTLASKERIKATIKGLADRGFLSEVVSTRAEALERIKALIPSGASVMNGSSRTLEEIGFIEYLKAEEHGWNNLHAAIFKESDPAKQAQLRKQSVLSDYYIGSAHAVSESGEMVFASNSGSQLPHLVFTSQNLVLVVGTQKITRDLEDARRRVVEHVFPLEDARAKSVGWGGSMLSKELILHRENPKMGRKVHVILVEEKLGF